jgi:GH25 family lysozyme M1 (1,4-beta-N-acetylmuramidase)
MGYLYRALRPSGRTLAALLSCWLAASATGCTVEHGSAMGFELGEQSDSSASLTTRCAPGPLLAGIDVSVFQGTVDWSAVRGDGVDFAFIRVSDGLNTPDERFAANWAGARAAGVRRGVYQFFRPSQDAIAQADLLADAVGALAPGDLPPVLDLETLSGQSPAVVRARAQQWLERVEARLGVRPIIYTGPYFWRDQVGAPAFADDYPLWVAHYTSGCPLTPAPWSRWAFHQFTDDGRVNGISGPVDRNWFNGTEADLAALSVGAPVAQGDVTFDVLSPIDGSVVPNPVTFSFASEGVDRIDVFADGYLFLSFDPAATGTTIAYRFLTANVARELRAVAYGGDGLPLAERELTITPIDETGTLSLLAPADGATVADPVAFTWTGTGVDRVVVRADGWDILDFRPDVDGWSHTYSFQLTDVPRAIEAIGYDSGGAPVAVSHSTVTPHRPDDAPALFVLSPTGGTAVDNPVTFSFAGQALAEVRLEADGYPFLSFAPEVDGWTHTYSFFTTGDRHVTVSGIDDAGDVVVVRELDLTVLPDAPPPTTRAGLAWAIREHHHAERLTLWEQTFGRFDGADPLSNIDDTAEGGAALTSCYGTAPCDSVLLSINLLEAMRDLREVYGYQYFVTSIAGASHSANSLHYAGRAVDVDEINGVRVNGHTAATQAFMNACWSLGAVEVFGPSNDPADHGDHIHCGF